MTEGTRRKLAAVVSADVAGYSRLMGADEDGTLAALKAHRNAVDPAIFSHGGRIVKTTGDGLLLEFPSAVAAVEAALATQRIMAERDALLPAERRMRFRIGVHLGEVIVDGDDIFGDTVNVAARLQEIAEPGGIALSGAARDAVRRQIEAPLVELGPQQLKNIAEPVPVWRVDMGDTEQAGLQAAADRPPRERSAIAVLPFDNMSADPEQDYFVDGLTEDLITALSLITDLKVIARNSTFAYKGQAKDVKLVAAELDARYVLEGSARKAGNRIRITAQLIDAETGRHMWAERYDRELTDIFDLQDELTANIASHASPALRKQEIAAARQRNTRDLDTWDLYWRALHQYYRQDREGFVAARDLCEQMLSRDDSFAPAHYCATWVAFVGMAYGYFEPTPERWQDMLRHAERGVALAPGDSLAHVTLGMAYAFSGRHQAALQHASEALRINSSVPPSHAALGIALWLNGDHADAIAAMETAWRLGSNEPDRVNWAAVLCSASYLLRRYDAALSWVDQWLRLKPGDRPALGWRAASLAQLGRLDEARVVMAPIAAQMQLAWARLAFRRPEDLAHYRDGLIKAGMPE